MFFRKALLVVMLVVLSIPVVGYAQGSEEKNPVLFIGTVTGVPDEFVGLAIDGQDVTLYVCDGKADEGTVSIAQWFVGTLADNQIDITAGNGRRVEVTLTEDSATGKLTFAEGSTQDFVLTLAQGNAALYRSEFSLEEVAYVGGWLILEDGSVRGAILKAGSSVLAPASLSDRGVLRGVDVEPSD